MYDTQALKEDVGCDEICEDLGLQIKKMGSKYSILCPFHNDRHFGSAYVDNKRFTCFACGATADVFSLVQEVNGCSFSDAVSYVASYTGTPSKYEISATEQHNEEKPFPLSQEELELLGLKKFYYADIPMREVDAKEACSKDKLLSISVMEDSKFPYLYVYGSRDKLSLSDFYDEDPEAFSYIVNVKAKEVEDKCDRLLNRDFLSMKLKAEEIFLLKEYLKATKIKAASLEKRFAC